jgi:hypothetical protein
MSRVRSAHVRPAARAAKASTHPALLRALTERFRRDPDSPDLPLVAINRIPQTRTVHLLVVWKEWQAVEPDHRGRIVADAFVAAHSEDADAVTVTMALTPGEALTLGMLPFRIEPLVRASDKVSAQDVSAAMRSAGGVLVQVGGEKQLRFLTRRQAEEAYRRLTKSINKPIWSIVVEGRSSDDA